MISQVQRELRTGRIGSSDAAAICGLDQYRTPYDVWAQLTGKVKPFAGNKATEVGTFIERGVLDWVEQDRGLVLSRDQFIDHPDGIRVANLDSISLASLTTIVECKTTGIIGPSRAAMEYGDPEDGIEAIPQSVVIQTHHQAAVASHAYGKIDRIVVAVLIGWRGLVAYEFEPNQKLVEVIAEKEIDFHRKYIQTDTPPEGGPSEEIAKILPRVADKSIDVDSKLIANWRVASDVFKRAADAESEAKAKVLAALGDAEIGKAGDKLVTYKKYARKGYTVEPTEYRMLKFKQIRNQE